MSSDATPSFAPSSERRLFKAEHRFWARLSLFLCLIIVLVYVGDAAMKTYQETQSVHLSEAQRAVANVGLTSTGHKSLSPKFTDKQGRLVADAPVSPGEWVNPDTLVVAHITGPDETPGKSWAEFEDRLAKATGKKVVDQTYENSSHDIAEATNGKVTLLALHSPDAPFLVNTYGFVPLAVLGDSSGVNGNRLDLIVPAGSSITSPADLKGHRLVCTVPSSIVGYRAAVAYLMRDAGLRPNVDYEIIFSLGQKESIAGIADKKYEAAAVSDEKLQKYLAQSKISLSQFKIIHQSQTIPRTTIGCFSNLNPTLAEQLRQAILASPDSDATPAPTNRRFLPLDYKRDFEFVRSIDDQFDPRFDAQKNQKHSD